MTSSSVPCSSLPDTGSSVATGAARAFAALAAFWLIVTIPASPASASGDTTTASPAATTATSRSGESAARSDQAAAIVGIAREKMAADHLKAVILRVTIDGKEVVTEALGESMTGVPATKDMHFRNGAVAISYVATLLLQLVDQKKVRLDDKVSKWLPDIPHADRVTLGQLAQMTSGYHDYVLGNLDFDKALSENPFRQWTPRELLAYATSKPLVYEPGTNWNYAHTNYVILGLALEKITGKPIPRLLQENILGPLRLRNTADPQTPEIPQPLLHTFTSERREALGILPSTRFYEESTYWNPSWTITHGAIQYTDIYDMTTTAEAIGTGRLLSPESHKAQIDPKLRGFGTPVEGCATCAAQTDHYTYGIGVVLTGSWIMQNPLFSGGAAVMAYLPSKKIAIAVAVTFNEEAFDQTGGYKNSGDDIFRAIGAYLAPDDPPPVKR
jgi:CubicO group peptidase (beta-lactamase class C family)